MHKIFVDCDPGVDDSIALLYLLRRKDVKVMGISTGFGNTSAAQGAKNAASLIELSGAEYDIPIGIGSEVTIHGKSEPHPVTIHGANGIGNVELIYEKEYEFTDGVKLLVDVMRENPGEVTLITLGRYTNVALALEMEPKLPELVKRVVSMGGTIYHPGNAGPMAEANICGDADAADAVFQAGFDISLAGLDVTMNTWLTLDKLRNAEIYLQNDRDRKVYAYVTECLKHYMIFNAGSGLGAGVCPVHDPSAMLLALEPQLYGMTKMKARVETGGVFSRGQIVVDNRPLSMEANYVNFALEVNDKKAVDYLLKGLFFPDMEVRFD